MLGLAVAWVLFVPVADWLAHHDVGSATGALHETALDNARGLLLTLGAGLFAAGALWFTARNFTLSREGQVTDRYTKAIEQLGSDKLDVRIGGIYALERIARDSARDHPAVMEVLTAFIHEYSREPWPPPGPEARNKRWIRPDIQAAVTVVGRRDARLDVRRVNLSDARLLNAFLPDADLGAAYLVRTDLTGAFLGSANLAGAALHDAKLTRATLKDANLTGALAAEADLSGANLSGAFLGGTDFSGADLAGATWPQGTPAPEGWKLHGSGRLMAADTGAQPAAATRQQRAPGPGAGAAGG